MKNVHNKLKQNRGHEIVVAVIITSIILAILVVASLKIALSENGNIRKAQQGVKDYSNAQIDEKKQFENTVIYINEWT